MLRFKNMYHHICIKRDILVLITKELLVFFTILELYCKQSFMTTMMTNHDIVDVSHYWTNCNIYSKFINGIHKTLLVFLISFYVALFIKYVFNVKVIKRGWNLTSCSMFNKLIVELSVMWFDLDHAKRIHSFSHMICIQEIKFKDLLRNHLPTLSIYILPVYHWEISINPFLPWQLFVHHMLLMGIIFTTFSFRSQPSHIEMILKLCILAR